MEEGQDKLQKLAEKRYQAYRSFFTTEEGEEVLADLMRAAHYHTSTIGRDPYETYFNEGQRVLIQQIIKTAQLKPQQVKKITEKLNNEDQYYFG